MLNKAIKEIMSEQGAQANVLCVAMGQSESTFSRMFMKDGSDPKSSSIALLARRLNINVSDIYLKAESLQPELCRFFYSEKQSKASRMLTGSNQVNEVYINGEWIEYSEVTGANRSSEWADVIYLGTAPRWHVKLCGKVQCPDLYMQLCKELRNSK